MQDREADLGDLPSPGDETEWESCVDLAGNERMRPVMPKPEDGSFVVVAEDVPQGVTVRPDAWSPGYLRFDPSPPDHIW